MRKSNREGGGVMGQEKVEKILSEQLALLAERSKSCACEADLLALTEGMVRVASVLLPD